MLCETCIGFLRDAERKITSSTADPYTHPGHYVFMEGRTRSEEQYKRAIQQGCKFCITMWRLSQPAFQPKFFATVRRQPDPERRTYYLKHGLSVELEILVDGQYPFDFELDENHSCSHTSGMQSLTEIMSTTADAHSLVLAQSCFETCLKDHQACKLHGREPLSYPERLIDVGFRNDMFKVIDTTSTQVQGPYMTLSHRWGTNQNKLNDSSAEELYQGMPVSSLSQTYQDAITQARRFGVRYLWIDSLCIFQDNRLDIRNAASSMAEVYSNSICNISALTARQDGLFSARNFGFIDRRSFELCQQQSGLSCCYLIHDLNTWASEVAKTPLANRGWVAQEMTLAPRTIYFGENQLFWHCISQSTHETDFKHQDESTRWNRPIYSRAGTAFRMLSLLAGTHVHAKDKLLDAWYYFIERYTALDLSFESDKLLAVAGIAKKLGQVLPDDYLAGHWKSSLPVSLMWWRSTSQPDPTGRVEPYQCPTWSWACSRDPIDMRILTTNKKVVARYVRASIQTHNGDAYGMVNSAALSIQAMLVPLTVVSRPHQSSPGAMLRGTMRTPDGHEFEVYNSLDVEAELPLKVFFAPITTNTTESKHSNPASGSSTSQLRLHVFGILLRLVDEPCTFERAGNLEHSGWVEEFSLWMPPGFMELFDRAALDEEPNIAPIGDSKLLTDITLI